VNGWLVFLSYPLTILHTFSLRGVGVGNWEEEGRGRREKTEREVGHDRKEPLRVTRRLCKMTR
jgi:hypothetical protein